MARLIFERGGERLLEYRLEGRCMIGRSDVCDVVVPDETVSRTHCIVQQEGATWSVLNRGRHGTRVSGEPIEGARSLSDGDAIELGIYRLVFQTGGRDPGATATHSNMAAEPAAQILSGRASADGGVALGVALLEVVEGIDKGQRFRLEKRRQTLGAPGSDLVLQDPTLRRDHVRVGVSRGRVTLIPGAGPAILGGEKVRDVLPLYAGESFHIGDTVLTVQDSVLSVEADPEDSLGDMVGPSKVMRYTFGLIRRFAPHGYPVLIIGESGTGKELAARAIHDQSNRAGGPFVAINCGAISENLIESELFGHEKGAFTGATERREGAFQRADGGTLFLDELGEMAAAAQVKMLRSLQTGGVRRVGGAKVEYPDVRIVAATNRDLGAALNEGTFRADLFHRLTALTIALPPLRDRMEDLPALAGALCERIAPDARQPIRLSAEALSLLRTHNWPGNVRELRNVLIRAYVTAGPLIQPPAIQFSPWSFPAVDQIADDRGGDLLEQQERRLLHEALIRHRNNRSAVARELGIARSTLHYKIRRFGLDRSS